MQKQMVHLGVEAAQKSRIRHCCSPVLRFCLRTDCNYSGRLIWAPSCLSASLCLTLTHFHTLKLVDARHNPRLMLSAKEQPNLQADIMPCLGAGIIAQGRQSAVFLHFQSFFKLSIRWHSMYTDIYDFLHNIKAASHLLFSTSINLALNTLLESDPEHELALTWIRWEKGLKKE